MESHVFATTSPHGFAANHGLAARRMESPRPPTRRDRKNPSGVGCRGLVEEQQARLLEHRSRHGEALLLPPGEVAAALADVRVPEPGEGLARSRALLRHTRATTTTGTSIGPTPVENLPRDPPGRAVRLACPIFRTTPLWGSGLLASGVPAVGPALRARLAAAAAPLPPAMPCYTDGNVVDG